MVRLKASLLQMGKQFPADDGRDGADLFNCAGPERSHQHAQIFMEAFDFFDQPGLPKAYRVFQETACDTRSVCAEPECADQVASILKPP